MTNVNWAEQFRRETGTWWDNAKEKQQKQEQEASAAHAKAVAMLAQGIKKSFDQEFLERIMSFARPGETLREFGGRVALPAPIILRSPYRRGA